MKASKLFAVILLFIIAAAAVVTGGIYTNGFESLSSLYLLVDGEKYTKDAEISLSSADEITVQVKGAGFKAVEYEVSAASNVSLAFTSGGTSREWNGRDVTAELITLTADGFTLTPKTTEQLITSIYADAEYTADETVTAYGFTVTVTTTDGEDEITLTFVSSTGAGSTTDPDSGSSGGSTTDPDSGSSGGSTTDPDSGSSGEQDLIITPDAIAF